jgi:hypothetical protein
MLERITRGYGGIHVLRGVSTDLSRPKLLDPKDELIYFYGLYADEAVWNLITITDN